jgi:hypothetical protein
MDTNNSWNPFKETVKDRKSYLNKVSEIGKSDNPKFKEAFSKMKAKRDSDRYERQLAIRSKKGDTKITIPRLRREVKDRNDIKVLNPTVHSVITRKRNEARDSRREKAKSFLSSK